MTSQETCSGAEIRDVLKSLAAQKVDQVVVFFSGSADSGMIDIIRYLSDGKKHVGKPADFSGEGVIENHVYAELAKTGVDWCNQEGGQGHYEFRYDGEKWTYTFVVDVNYMEVVTEHESSGTFDEEARA